MKTIGPEWVLAHPESTNNEHEIITARNEDGARFYFHRRLSFC